MGVLFLFFVFPALGSPSGERSQPELSHAAATEGNLRSALRLRTRGCESSTFFLRAAGSAAGCAAAGSGCCTAGCTAQPFVRFTHFLFRLPSFQTFRRPFRGQASK